MTDREKILDGLRHCVPETKGDGKLYCSSCPYCISCKSGGVFLPIVMVEDIRKLLKEQPQIVRCKDCKWYDKQKNWCISLDIAEQGEDWFCADGEAKDE